MFYQDALRAHIAWNARLMNYIEGEGTLDPAKVSRDDLCDIGRWIVEQAGDLAEISEFGEVRQIHAQLHGCAAEVIRLVDAGDKTRAREVFESRYKEIQFNLANALAFLSNRLFPPPEEEEDEEALGGLF